MATVNEKMTAIADNIRSKTGKTEPLTLDGMASGVNEVYESGKENTLAPIRESLINKGEELSETADVEEITGCIDGLSLISELTDFKSFFYLNARLYLLPNFKYETTSKGTDFSSMFSNCSSITTIPQIDTSKGTDFHEMFSYCRNITTIPLIDTSNGTNFSSMFSWCTSLTTIPKIDTRNGIYFRNTFYYCNSLTTIPKIDTSNGTFFTYMFYNCTRLTTIPKIDTSNGTYFDYMFYKCTSLTTIPELNASKNTSFDNTFNNCTKLQNITFVGTINANGLNLSYSTKLTHDSLMSLINALADKSGDTSTTWKVTIGSTNKAKLTAEELEIATMKGWSIV